ncbi:MAG TPA: hypothetical protein VF782_11070 [Allosphingosinicella sp.]|jgi:hypothetical protein
MDKLSVEAIAFLFGCALLVVAIVGGGISFKGTRIPKLPMVPRVLCGLVGLGLVLTGLKVINLPSSPERPPRPRHCQNLPPNNVPPNTPSVTITDRLGDNQDYERIDMSIDGRLVGTLCVEEGRESDKIVVPQVNREAQWSATGSEQRKLRDKTVRLRSIQGRGSIDLTQAGSYSVRIVADGSSDSVQVVWLRRN